jgi:uncharacterized protein YkwD
MSAPASARSLRASSEIRPFPPDSPADGANAFRMRHTLIIFAAALLVGCLGEPTRSVSYVDRPEVDRPATLDPGTAQGMINAYRKSNGLPPVQLDPKLMAVAANHAKRMAAANKLDHVLRGEGSFAKRLSAGGYDAAAAVENIGAGYHNLNEAFSGWRNSPHHRRNMLNKDVTAMGIAVAYNKASKFKDFWCLVMARPDEKRPVAGPDGGPPVAAGDVIMIR